MPPRRERFATNCVSRNICRLKSSGLAIWDELGMEFLRTRSERAMLFNLCRDPKSLSARECMEMLSLFVKFYETGPSLPLLMVYIPGLIALLNGIERVDCNSGDADNQISVVQKAIEILLASTNKHCCVPFIFALPVNHQTKYAFIANDVPFCGWPLAEFIASSSPSDITDLEWARDAVDAAIAQGVFIRSDAYNSWRLANSPETIDYKSWKLVLALTLESSTRASKILLTRYSNTTKPDWSWEEATQAHDHLVANGQWNTFNARNTLSTQLMKFEFEKRARVQTAIDGVLGHRIRGIVSSFLYVAMNELN